jgi:hypothetical protein
LKEETDEAYTNSLLDRCSAELGTVKALILNMLAGSSTNDLSLEAQRQINEEFGEFLAMDSGGVTAERIDRVGKVTCAVSYSAKFRGIVGRLAEIGRGPQSASLRRSAISSGIWPEGRTRVTFTWRPTADGRGWLELLQ